MSNTYQIYLISDSTGETLDRVFLALKAQFKNIEYKVHSYFFTRTENQILKILEDAQKNENSVILYTIVDNNYLMIIHNSIPIITDIFLRPQEKQHIMDVVNEQIPTDAEAVIRRYAMQIKQAITDYEVKYDNKVTSIQVVSSLKNISFLLPAFKKNLPTTGFINFDPLQIVSVR